MGEFRLYRRLLRQARPYWRSFTGLLVLGLLAAPVALLAPVPLKIVVDSVLGTRPLPSWLEAVLPGGAATPAVMLVLAAVLLVGITLLGQFRSLLNNLLRTSVGERLVLDFRSRLIDQVHHVALSYHDTRGTADSIYRIQQDAPAIQNIMADGIVPFVSAAFALVSMFVVTAHLDGQLALIALAVCPPLFLLTWIYRPRLRRQSRQVKTLESSALAIVQETLGALRLVKAFGTEEREKRRLLHSLSEGMAARIRLAFLDGGYGLLIGLVVSLGLATVLLVGVRHVRFGVLTLGELLMVLSYVGQLYDPLKTMSRKVSGLQSYLASAERAFGLLDERPDVTDRPRARPVGRVSGAVAFRGVGFAYETGQSVLHDVSFEVQAGTRLGIVGASGAGKTTLVSLLMRFYDPDEGQILLDGMDLRDCKLVDVRRQFAVVPQEPVLFAASIAENIAYARPGARHEEIVAAAQAANAHDFIVQLPEGYDAQVGERGVQLSGGQRQRIAIARAFLKDSPVLILDEPTSAIDAESETAIRGAIRHLMRGRTVMLITHRPSMLEGCDTVLVLENGRVAAADWHPRRATRKAGAVPAPGSRYANLKNHPAVQAWSRLYPRDEPQGITPLRVRQKKNQVYRLEGVGGSGGAVIAKRCLKPEARVERTVYEEILPRLPISSLRYHGFLEEPETDYCWLFPEAAGGADYSNLLADHRAQAGRWLGLVHTTAAARFGDWGGQTLPPAGASRFQTQLQDLHELIARHVNNPVLTCEDVAFLEALNRRLEDLARNWGRLEAISRAAGVPPTLVHGDFNGKNMRLRNDNGHGGILVFDWEVAGWGIPAVDLAQVTVPSSSVSANPDVGTYWETVRDHWPGTAIDGLRRLADCGTVFRALSTLFWDALSLPSDWAHGYVEGMQQYAAEMDHALERLGWGRPAPATTRVEADVR